MPVPRVRYQNVFALSRRRRSRCPAVGGPAGRADVAAVVADEAGGEVAAPRASRRGVAEHDRGGRGDVRVEARGRGDGDAFARASSAGSPVAGRARGARCHGRCASAGRSCSTSRGRPRRSRRRARRCRGARRGRRRCGRPAAGGGGPATATSPPRETSTPGPFVRRRSRGQRRRPGLGGRAEVELDPARDRAACSRLEVELDVVPAARRGGRGRNAHESRSRTSANVRS